LEGNGENWFYFEGRIGMATNSFGKIFRITSFGESHGSEIGVVIDGCPSNIAIEIGGINEALSRRKPGQSSLTTERKESDLARITSGIFNGKTTGAPICIVVPNANQKSKDYDHLANVYRPSHADFTYDQKYSNRDHLGGGRASARITAGWVAAGAVAEQILTHFHPVRIVSYVDQIYTLAYGGKPNPLSRTNVDRNKVRCPDDEIAAKMEACILEMKEDGNSVGGLIKTVIENCPIGLGDPLFEKLHANLAKAMMSINAVKGFSYGDGFESVLKTGKESNDEWESTTEGQLQTRSNHSGGIQGGISNGMDILFSVAFKPTASISKEQHTVTKDGANTKLQISGRHDPCVVPRAVPIVEALSAIVLLDALLANRALSKQIN
jgi:chorismate synthase